MIDKQYIQWNAEVKYTPFQRRVLNFKVLYCYDQYGS